MALLNEAELRERVERLARIDRESASAGEAEAAGQIAAELGDAGARVRVEREEVHGTYWWPVGLLTGLATVAGLRWRRQTAFFTGLAVAAAVTDDTTGGSQWFRRTFLPKGETTNVVAEIGDSDASETVVVSAHHDAAHSGLVFHPELPRALFRRFPELNARTDTTPGTM